MIDIPICKINCIFTYKYPGECGGLILIYLGFLFLEQGHFNKKIAALVSDREREEDINKIITSDMGRYLNIALQKFSQAL